MKLWNTFLHLNNFANKSDVIKMIVLIYKRNFKNLIKIIIQSKPVAAQVIKAGVNTKITKQSKCVRWHVHQF